MKLYAYNQGSASAKALAEALGIKRIKHQGKKLKTEWLINWGASEIKREVYVSQHGLINNPFNVAKASNKLSSLLAFKEAGVACPEFTERHQEADRWLENGFDVVGRAVLNGHSGKDIIITKSADWKEGNAAFPLDLPLYTKYVKKKDEYRIHVFNGEIIFQQRKARKKDVPDEEVNWQVRNHANGFIFANDAVIAPNIVKEQAIMAVKALGLDFGAVDIGYKDGEACVYEVNTAPGLTGKTLEAYVNAFRNQMA